MKCTAMFGNGAYPPQPVIDPIGPDTGAFRVLRGGAWGDVGGYCRSAIRFRARPDIANNDTGFRLARGQ